MPTLLETARERAVILWKAHGLLNRRVEINGRPLTPQEAVGNPGREDLPLRKGRERLMEAHFEGDRGQAFSDEFDDFSASLDEIATLPLDSNFRRGVFIASLNATLRHLGQAGGTVHCRNQGPTECAKHLLAQLKTDLPQGRVLLVGFQPLMAEALAGQFELRILDLDEANIGTERFGTRIEGPDAAAQALQWADIRLVTGSSIVNNTIDPFLEHPGPTLLYGTTIAGAAALAGRPRFCPCSD